MFILTCAVVCSGGVLSCLKDYWKDEWSEAPHPTLSCLYLPLRSPPFTAFPTTPRHRSSSRQDSCQEMQGQQSKRQQKAA
mmetsp:Transcript_8958/g.22642  ORF Transcript_8958/g.22642 Transcript_8958/m.22642 type:complete len:80 (+) Transcript_8958:558-797(+)